MSPNKILAAQLYAEFKAFFPNNAVEYFISYYDYYQPEAYVPQSDTYIEKDSSVNDHIDRLRLKATIEPHGARRRDHRGQRVVHLRIGIARRITKRLVRRSCEVGKQTRAKLLDELIAIHYERNEIEFSPRKIPRARRHRRNFSGLFGHARCASNSSATKSKRSGNPSADRESYRKRTRLHLSRPPFRDARADTIERALVDDREELGGPHCAIFNEARKTARSAAARTAHALRHGNDARKWGFATASKIIRARSPAAAPGNVRLACSIIFRKIFLAVIDESHVTLPQIGGMYEGDRSRNKRWSITDSACRARWTTGR